MNFHSSKPKAKRELLVLPFWQGPKGAFSKKEFTDACRYLLDSGDFSGKEGEYALVYGKERILLLGLGKKELHTDESMRRSYATVSKVAASKKIRTVHLVVPEGAQLRAAAEGVLLSNYHYDANKQEKIPRLEKIFIEGNFSVQDLQEVERITEAVCFTRDLVNGNADLITPDYLSDLAKRFKHPKVSIKVLRRKEIEKEGLGLLQAVSRASVHEPALIILQYKGNPRSKKNPVIIGKGVTFDTGGLLIKPRGGMEEMRGDMAGGAVCFGVLKALISLQYKGNATFVIAATENGIGSKAYKPGDVYKSYSGKTVEISDTDAEGRLILADALEYTAKHLQPTCMVDVATLTGAMVVSLGEEVAGFFSSEEKLARGLEKAASQTGERLWRMPLEQDYRCHLKSDIADMKNTGEKNARAISAALFLQAFVQEGIPWAHIDLAGPAFFSKERFYNPKNGTGFGVRLLIEFILKSNYEETQ